MDKVRATQCGTTYQFANAWCTRPPHSDGPCALVPLTRMPPDRDPAALAELFRFFEKTRLRGDRALPELRERVLVALTPAIATEDALTLAGVHDLACRYLNALDCVRAMRPQDSAGARLRADENVARLEAAIRYVLGVQS